jgi:hypothetical protein
VPPDVACSPGSAEPLEPRRAPIDLVQRRKDAGQILIDGSTVRRGALAHHPVRINSSLNVIHDKKWRAQDRFFLAQQLHARYRHVGLGQRRHDTVFAFYLMGPGQQLARRLFAQHVVATGGTQMIRGVALSALELANLQLTVEARQSST